MDYKCSLKVCVPVIAGTVLKLGTEKHHKGLLRGIDNMTDIGCFALTELGFGERLASCRSHSNTAMINSRALSRLFRSGQCIAGGT